jgi:acyl-CoA thioester hydrolase
MNDEHPAEQGIRVAEGSVKPEWIDSNGHMNVAYYILAFDRGVDLLWSRAGITDDYIEKRRLSTFAVEAHITYQQELCEGDSYRVTAQILALDNKRLHQFQRLYNAATGALAATAEWLNLHIDLDTRRVCPWPDDILAAFTAIAKEQGGAHVPPETGNQIKVKSPTYALTDYLSDE